MRVPIATAAKRLTGVAMALVAGLLYGNNFTPPTYMQDNLEGPDGNSVTHVLSYVFSHFTGIFAMSTVWFLVYCAVMKSNPRINPRLVIPGFVSGAPLKPRRWNRGDGTAAMTPRR